ncbi:hypothetical protein G7046_g4834 [Stylonectria norvegica]|nr:hypothetical protein G7046_g4834 [Stylonectria norvegica]
MAALDRPLAGEGEGGRGAAQLSRTGQSRGEWLKIVSAAFTIVALCLRRRLTAARFSGTLEKWAVAETWNLGFAEAPLSTLDTLAMPKGYEPRQLAGFAVVSPGQAGTLPTCLVMACDMGLRKHRRSRHASHDHSNTPLVGFEMQPGTSLIWMASFPGQGAGRGTHAALLHPAVQNVSTVLKAPRTDVCPPKPGVKVDGHDERYNLAV